VKAALEFSGADSSAAELLDRLRAQVAKAEGRVRQQPFGVHPALAAVLPEPGLKPGSAYSLDSGGSLLLALLAEPSHEGHWCGVIGLPTFAAEAARLAGVRLDRLVLVPDPGDQWLAVTAALAEVVPVLAVRPPARVREGDASRLASRLRDRGGVLLVIGDWPRVEARLALSDSQWQGLGIGHGCLASRQVQVSATSRRYPSGRSAQLVLPAPDGRLAAVPVAPAVDRLKVAG
jgi:hypothetical protein